MRDLQLQLPCREAFHAVTSALPTGREDASSYIGDSAVCCADVTMAYAVPVALQKACVCPAL